MCAGLLALVMLLVGCVFAENASANLPPTEPDEIAELVEEAMGVYAWFTLWPLGGDLEEPMEEGVSEFYRVLDDRYDTRLKLAEFALKYFSLEIVTELFDRGLYQEKDGILYVTDRFDITDENISSVVYEVASQGDGWIEYHANVTYQAGTSDEHVRAYDYRYEQTENGWAFTQFAFYWEGERSNLDG